MTDFFQGLSAIGDTIANNRARSERARTLADVGRQLGAPGEPDYKALAARLFAAGDARSAVLVLRMAAQRAAGGERRTGAPASPALPPPYPDAE